MAKERRAEPEEFNVVKTKESSPLDFKLLEGTGPVSSQGTDQCLLSH